MRTRTPSAFGPIAARCGFTLLEVLIASLVLTAALVPIVANFSSVFHGFGKTREATHATMIGQAILENVRYRLYDGDTRFFTLNDSPEERRRKLRNPRNRFRDFFTKLREEGQKVTEVTSGDCSQYFVDFANLRGTPLHGLTASSNPGLFQDLASYRVTLEVSWSVPENLIDSDEDGRDELDMAEVLVTVSWQDRTQEERQERFFTMLTHHQYLPPENLP
ncbi:MAG: type II secretion system protein [Candidatus Riflebacteria bacterium]|nr:type II secretion system protein [Candidatus Riflebacteria bacterium]